MIRRLNFTRRKKIAQRDVEIKVTTGDDGRPFLEVELALAEYALPPTAKVYIEAYRQPAWMRFDFGTVASVTPPNDRTLTEFDCLDGVRFRIRVTEPVAPHGLLLAEADLLTPKVLDNAPAATQSLLPVIPGELDHEVCKVEFLDSGPVLKVNAELGNFRAIAKSPSVYPTVLPNALREILTRILLVEQYTDVDDESDWRSQWLSMAALLPGVGTPPQDAETAEKLEWVDRAVRSFCRKHSLVECFAKRWNTAEES